MKKTRRFDQLDVFRLYSAEPDYMQRTAYVTVALYDTAYVTAADLPVT